MRAPSPHGPTWRGWTTGGVGVPGSVTSAPLPAGASVRSRMFPKTRSWFALGAPLELLSPLSVLRILFADGDGGVAGAGPRSALATGQGRLAHRRQLRRRADLVCTSGGEEGQRSLVSPPRGTGSGAGVAAGVLRGDRRPGACLDAVSRARCDLRRALSRHAGGREPPAGNRRRRSRWLCSARCTPVQPSSSVRLRAWRRCRLRSRSVS